MFDFQKLAVREYCKENSLASYSEVKEVIQSLTVEDCYLFARKVTINSDQYLVFHSKDTYQIAEEILNQGEGLTLFSSNFLADYVVLKEEEVAAINGVLSTESFNAVLRSLIGTDWVHFLADASDDLFDSIGEYVYGIDGGNLMMYRLH